MHTHTHTLTHTLTHSPTPRTPTQKQKRKDERAITKTFSFFFSGKNVCRNNVVLDSSLLVGGSFFFFIPSDQVSFITKFSLIKWKYISADLSADEIKKSSFSIYMIRSLLSRRLAPGCVAQLRMAQKHTFLHNTFISHLTQFLTFPNIARRSKYDLTLI